MSRDRCVALPCGAMGCLRFKIAVFPAHTHLLFFCKLDVFNLAYLYVLHVLTKHFTWQQNCLKMSKPRNKSIKFKYKAKNE